MADIEPGGYWSHTLGQDLQDCHRRVYYRVYGSWSGWSRRNGDLPHLLYRAKVSDNMATFVGRQVHYMVQRIIERVRARLKLAPESLILERVEEVLRHAVTYSTERRWLRVDNPKRATLILNQHLTGADLHSTEVDAAVNKAQRAMTAFFEKYLPYIRTLPPQSILLIDSLDHMDHRGFRLFMSADFVAAREDRVIIDWKTGVNANSDQLKVYALHLVHWEEREHHHVLDPHIITGRSVPLLHPENEEVLQIEPKHLKEALARIDRDIDILKSLHEAGMNRDELAFAKTDHTGLCEGCSFRFYCDLRPR